MSRCDTCRYWGGGENPDAPAMKDTKVQRWCRAVRHYGDCDDFEDTTPDVPDFRKRAYVSDASGYAASLWTAADFGCVLWEKR